MKPPVVNNERQTITITEEIDVPEGTFEEVIAYFQELWEKYGYSTDARLSYYLSDESYDDICEYNVTYTRLETDEEMNNRIESEKIALKDWMDKQTKINAEVAILARKAELQREIAQLEANLKELK
jgi:hypothetical protein